MDIFNFFANHPFWAWGTLCALLLVFELLSGTMYLLWFAIAAAITALLTMLAPQTPVYIDVLFFAIMAILVTVFGRKVFPVHLTKSAENINEPDSRHIGQIGIAAQDFDAGIGAVTLGDTRWRAVCDENPKAGNKLRIIKVDGATLGVEKISA